MKLLTTALLSLALATTASTASAITIAPTLGDIFGGSSSQTETGAQGLMFTDTDGDLDDSQFSLILEQTVSDESELNSFGLYLFDENGGVDGLGSVWSGSNGNSLFEIFSGSDAVGTTTTLTFDFVANTIQTIKTFQYGTVSDVTYGSADGSLYSTLSSLSTGSLEMGVYLESFNEDIYYSHNILNDDEERMVGIYDIPGGVVIGFESGDGVNDFNDLVVEALDIKPVPAPTTLAIFGLALLGLASTRRKA